MVDLMLWLGQGGTPEGCAIALRLGKANGARSTQQRCSQEHTWGTPMRYMRGTQMVQELLPPPKEKQKKTRGGDVLLGLIHSQRATGPKFLPAGVAVSAEPWG